MHTHQKRAYKGHAVQWTGNNTEYVLSLFKDASRWGNNAIMVRWQDPLSHICGITTMYHGWWVVTGEDGKVRIYTPQRFEILYEKI